MAAPGLLDRRRHDLLEHAEIDVAETLDVQASAGQLVFAERLEQRAVDSPPDVDRQILLARRKPDDRPVGGAAAGVLKLVTPEADDARAPHRRGRARRV